MLFLLDNISHPITYVTEGGGKQTRSGVYFVGVTPASQQSWLHLLLMSLHFNTNRHGSLIDGN